MLSGLILWLMIINPIALPHRLVMASNSDVRSQPGKFDGPKDTPKPSQPSMISKAKDKGIPLIYLKGLEKAQRSQAKWRVIKTWQRTRGVTSYTSKDVSDPYCGHSPDGLQPYFIVRAYSNKPCELNNRLGINSGIKFATSQKINITPQLIPTIDLLRPRMLEIVKYHVIRQQTVLEMVDMTKKNGNSLANGTPLKINSAHTSLIKAPARVLILRR